jgi:hypothetical protein
MMERLGEVFAAWKMSEKDNEFELISSVLPFLSKPLYNVFLLYMKGDFHESC